jgi:hypothetical protein
MPDSPTSEAEPDFICDCDEWMRDGCDKEPFYREHEGKRYCVLHFPSKEKSADFRRVLQRKLENKDFNFPGVWFPDPLFFDEFEFDQRVNFNSATFSGEALFYAVTFSAGVEFNRATFSAAADFKVATFSAMADFSRASFGAAAEFSSATFSAKAEFTSATFGAAADFDFVTFSAPADFSKATFDAAASFRTATFNDDAEFINCTLRGKTDFWNAIFKGRVNFAGDKSTSVFSSTSSLDLQFARIEKPDRFSFHTLTLHPHWFINVDARRFDFINIHWDNYGKAKRELELLKDVPSRHRLLVIACRKLAANAEDNDRFRSASQFRRMAMDAERQENWSGLDFRKLNWWYWLASGYGERITQAFLVLLGIWFVAGLLYTRVGFARWEPKLATESDLVIAKRDDVGAPLKFSRALTYSAGVMTLQKPEPRPATTAAQAAVLLETILGPVQAALLALAIRRKFMR